MIDGRRQKFNLNKTAVVKWCMQQWLVSTDHTWLESRQHGHPAYIQSNSSFWVPSEIHLFNCSIQQLYFQCVQQISVSSKFPAHLHLKNKPCKRPFSMIVHLERWELQYDCSCQIGTSLNHWSHKRGPWHFSWI